jgi:RIO-like serine/threonine protein kinase
LQALGLDTIEKAMQTLPKGEVVRRAGNRTTYRVESEMGLLYVKVHRGVSLWRRCWPLGNTASGARTEWDAIGLLRRSGFDVPEPVAMGEASVLCGMPPYSFLITRAVEGPTLLEFLSKEWPTREGVSQAEMRKRVLRDISGMIRRFHASGFYHKDLYCMHLIVTKDERWGRPYIIDLQRVEQKHPPRHRWLVKDMAALLHSMPPTMTKQDRLRFLLRYLCKTKVDPEVRRWAAEIESKRVSMAMHVPLYP